MGEAFDYAEEFKSLDLNAVIKDLHALMTDFAGFVAGGLWPLRRTIYPHGLAQRGHVPQAHSFRRRADLAGPDPDCGPSLDRGGGHSGAESEDTGVRPVRVPY